MYLLTQSKNGLSAIKSATKHKLMQRDESGRLGHIVPYLETSWRPCNRRRPAGG